MVSAKDIEQKINSIKPILGQEYGVEKIGYFGSFASETQTEESDIDILVSLSKSVGWKFFDLKEYLEGILDRRVDLVTEGSIREQWKESIMQQVRYV
ncbi:MAG: nucleotidyltransferase family protein [Cyclobacteriaceae bacterium]